MGRRYEVDGRPKHWVERDRKGRFKNWVPKKRSMSQDRVRRGKKVKPGYGHRGDINPFGLSGFKKVVSQGRKKAKKELKKLELK